MMREPTDAERRAEAAAEAERERQLREGTGLDGEPDMLPIVRAVIRSLRDAPHALLDQARGNKLASGDAAVFVNTFIDAASPGLPK